MNNTQQHKYAVVTIYDQWETGVEFYRTLQEARKDYKRQQAKWEAYLVEVLQ